MIQIGNKEMTYDEFMDDLTRRLAAMMGVKAEPVQPMKDVLTTSEACAYLGIKKGSLYQLVYNHKIPYFKGKGGKMNYFRLDDLREYKAGHYIPSVSEAAIIAESRRNRKEY
ncbi:MAG: helix-turn-helix domain-containing protein [Prevotellaceae bacterium]|nr:helix-turn-helix domain-containing protein [Prevotellaceae bacterium]